MFYIVPLACLKIIVILFAIVASKCANPLPYNTRLIITIFFFLLFFLGMPTFFFKLVGKIIIFYFRLRSTSSNGCLAMDALRYVFLNIFTLKHALPPSLNSILLRCTQDTICLHGILVTIHSPYGHCPFFKSTQSLV